MMRAGQHQRDKAQVAKIAGHLVDDARGLRRGRSQIGQISLCGMIQPRAVQPRDSRDGTPGVGGAAKCRHHLGQRGAFTARGHVAMGGEYLFRQPAAGARHADDEDRSLVGIRCTRTVSKSVVVEVRHAGVDEGRETRAIQGLGARQHIMPALPAPEGAIGLAATIPE
jgi:hypothetical protein